MIKKFGDLEIGECFYFQNVKLKKVSDWQGQTMNGKHRIELAKNVHVLVCED
jgi:hypothetical protein